MKIKIKGLSKTLTELKKTQKLFTHNDRVLDKLAEISVEEIETAHQNAKGIEWHITTGGKSQEIVKSDIRVSTEGDLNRRTIVMTGLNFLFFEFGSGVTHNSPRVWANKLGVEVPDDISDIGTYDKGMGSLPKWGWQVDNNTYGETEGYSAVHGVANAINRVVDEVDIVIKEVKNE